MKIVLISDTHNQHNLFKIPDCDILIHSGDSTLNGTYGELTYFLNWFSLQHQAKTKIYVPGNHDFGMQKEPQTYKKFVPNVNILIDEELVVDGFKIYGTPWTPYFYDWAYNGLEEREAEGLGYHGGPGWNAKPDKDHPLLSEVYGKIPDDTNVLVCHGPPNLGLLGVTKEGVDVGSRELLKRIEQLPNLKIGAYGHIHEGRGLYIYKGVKHYNASSLGRDYLTTKEPIVVEI